MPDSPALMTVPSAFGPMLTRVGDFVTGQLEKWGAAQRNDLAMLRAFVDPGELVFDIGAHIGAFTVPLAQSAGPNGRVVAVEPDATSHALLAHNVAANGLAARVRTVHGAIGTIGANLSYVRVENHTSMNHFAMVLGSGDADFIPLDALAAQESAPLAVLKIDVEGMEVAVLRSGMGIIARDRPTIWVEVSAPQLARVAATVADLEALLVPLGYRFFRNGQKRDSPAGAFVVRPLESLAIESPLFDALALPAGHPKLDRAQRFAAG